VERHPPLRVGQAINTMGNPINTSNQDIMRIALRKKQGCYRSNLLFLYGLDDFAILKNKGSDKLAFGILKLPAFNKLTIIEVAFS
jgi:hypothetical protein